MTDAVGAMVFVGSGSGGLRRGRAGGGGLRGWLVWVVVGDTKGRAQCWIDGLGVYGNAMSVCVRRG